MNIPPFPMQRDELSAAVVHCKETARSSASPDLFKLAFSCIDLTTLNPTDTVRSVAAFTARVNSFELEFQGLPNVAAICVYPQMASVVRENLAAENVRVAAVAGGFPSSMTFKRIKIEEAREAVIYGAEEIDIVLPLWAFLEGNFGYCRDEISSVKNAIGDTHLKVILETGVLTDPEKIWQASLVSLEAGADFIKTSTGKMPVSATPESGIIMCKALEYWFQQTGERKGFKPAGGISTSADAMVYLTIVKEILGDKWLNNNLFRIGASRLANDLLSNIFERPVNYF